MASIAPALAEVRTSGHRPANNTDVSTPLAAIDSPVSENNAITAAMAEDSSKSSFMPEGSLFGSGHCC